MIKMRRVLVLIMIFLAWTACKKPILEGTQDCAITFNDTSNIHPKNAQFNALLDKYIQKGLPGISVYTTDDNGALIGVRGKADVLNDIAYKSCHVQKVASLTKWFMGALVFKLMEDSANSGLAYNDLDKPLSTWIPEKMLKNISNADQITLRQCMDHSTGLYDVITDSDFYLEVLNDPTKKWTPDGLLKYVRNKDSDFEPGQKHAYSNTNTLMVSLVVDYATGKPHHQLLIDNIINPLGLSNTVYHHHQNLPTFTAQGYYDLYQNENPINVTNYVTGSGNGYTGIYSNVFDLHKFMKAVVIDRTFLTAKSMSYIEQIGATDNEDVSYGLGIMKRFLKRGADFGWGHTGRDLGYAADLFYFPNKNVSITWCINYGADADSYLKPVILDFQKELIDLMQQ